MTAAVSIAIAPLSPTESSETASSMYSDTSSMTATRDDVVDLDTLDLDALLSAAKENLQRGKVSHPAKETKDDDVFQDSDEEEEDEESDDLKSVKKSIAGLPQLIDTFPKDQILSSIRSEDQSEQGSSASAVRKEMQFRQISDPVLVKAAKKAEKESTAGAKWFNMPRTELTPSLRRDWQLLQMRSVLDPKRHYKKETAPIPKYFQTGTIVEGNTEFFSARLTRKERKQTIADELLADDKAKDYFKRKYAEIQTQKQSGRSKHFKKVKEMRQKRK